jgi:hypothetical protein
MISYSKSLSLKPLTNISVGTYSSAEFPGTHWIGVWVGPRAGLDAVVLVYQICLGTWCTLGKTSSLKALL